MIPCGKGSGGTNPSTPAIEPKNTDTEPAPNPTNPTNAPTEPADPYEGAVWNEDKTLEHFGHKENVHTQLMHSAHCRYVRKPDEDGEGIFAKVILSFLEKLNFV